ncbi:MAG: hypothetical protein IPK82_33685 [Polyangiaceae bacterium]|nr:hypothetical protein [Polyangiaceae bacterium]
MSTALATRLIASGAVSTADAEAALLSSLARRIPFVRALIDTGTVSEAVLDQELEALGGIGLRQVTGMPELVNRLPPHFCRRMGVLPVRVDHAARVVEVAAADPLDPHLAAEVHFHLGVPVRVLRAPMSAIEDAIRRIELEAEAAAGRARRATPPFPHGAPESSNPPPPPPEPTPIPLVRKTGGPPDTLRMYKQTLRPGSMKALDFSDAPAPAPTGEGPPPTEPLPLRTPKSPAAESAEGQGREGDPDDVPRTLRESSPRLRDLTALPPEPLRGGEASTRAVRESTPRLRDLVKPPAEDKLRDSTPRLRDLARAILGETPATAFGVEASAPSPPAPNEGAAPPEPPAVSFPSLPPPSVVEQPGLLAADDDWGGLTPPAEPRPEPAAPRQRKPSRFIRPAIDIQLPQPPSERTRHRRSAWDGPTAGDVREPPPSTGETRPAGADAKGADPASAPEPSLPAPLPRNEPLDVRLVIDALRIAGSRDDVVAAGLRGLRAVGRRTAIFVVRRDGFHGWACNVEFGDAQKLRGVSFAADSPSIFATAVAAGSYLGPVPQNAVHAPLLAAVEAPTSDVAAAVVRAAGKPVMVLLADDLVDVKRVVAPRLLQLADAVGAALSRLLASRL